MRRRQRAERREQRGQGIVIRGKWARQSRLKVADCNREKMMKNRG